MTGNERAAPTPTAPRVIVLMGVTGAGKTTVGMALASALGWPFADADDFHSATNVERMRAGVPLTDQDREPWLATLRDRVAAGLRDGDGLVLACSALRQHYRDALVPREAAPGEVAFVHLVLPPAVLTRRLERRVGHFAGESLLDSQLRTLQAPSATAALRLDGDRPVDVLVHEIRRALDV